MATLAEIEQFVREHPDISDPGRPASDEWIDQAEKYLALRFPEEYRQFLRRWGTLAFGSVEFYGIAGDSFETASVPNGIWYTMKLRREIGLPQHFVVLCNNDGHEYYLLDTSDPRGSVVKWSVSTRQIRAASPATLFDFMLETARIFLSD